MRKSSPLAAVEALRVRHMDKSIWKKDFWPMIGDAIGLNRANRGQVLEYA
jgi:hypothetical protein